MMVEFGHFHLFTCWLLQLLILLFTVSNGSIGSCKANSQSIGNNQGVIEGLLWSVESYATVCQEITPARYTASMPLSTEQYCYQ